jgi:hypothetical protein
LKEEFADPEPVPPPDGRRCIFVELPDYPLNWGKAGTTAGDGEERHCKQGNERSDTQHKRSFAYK